jgi:hypothetical protein
MHATTQLEKVKRAEWVLINFPIILAIYAATSLTLGYGFRNPEIDVAGLIATAVSYLVTRRVVAAILGD